MSDFLVRLARRGAGLAPVIRARSVAPIAAIEAPVAEAPATPPHDVPLAPVVIALPGAAPAVSERGPSLGAAVPAPVAVAPTAVPSVQRKSAVGSAASALAVAPATVLARPAEAVPGAPRTAFAVEPAAPASAVPTVSAPRAPEPATTPRRWARSAEATPPSVVPASTARIEPSHEVRFREVGSEHRRGDVVREAGHAVERSAEPAASELAGPAAVTIQPLERAAPRADAGPSAALRERTVHVNIGAIEIFGAQSEPGHQAPVALAPAPVASPSLPASLAGGFDDYVALRSYAPWAW